MRVHRTIFYLIIGSYAQEDKSASKRQYRSLVMNSFLDSAFCVLYQFRSDLSRWDCPFGILTFPCIYDIFIKIEIPILRDEDTV